jgi:hypothetical protein
MEIKIGKSAHACSACGRVFTHDETLFSAVHIENQLLARTDYCVECWKPDAGTGAFCVWSPKFCDPKVAEQQPPEVFLPLRQLFYDAVQSEDRSELAVAYLAAQLLRRQKAFRLIKESDEGDGEVKFALFADRVGNRPIEVRDPNLTYQELEQGRRVLMERLNDLERPLEAETEAETQIETQTTSQTETETQKEAESHAGSE